MFSKKDFAAYKTPRGTLLIEQKKGIPVELSIGWAFLPFLIAVKYLFIHNTFLRERFPGFNSKMTFKEGLIIFMKAITLGFIAQMIYIFIFVIAFAIDLKFGLFVFLIGGMIIYGTSQSIINKFLIIFGCSEIGLVEAFNSKEAYSLAVDKYINRSNGFDESAVQDEANTYSSKKNLNLSELKWDEYCLRCFYYDFSIGTCSQIHENVKSYPKKFSKCNGEYFQLDENKLD